MSTGKTPGKREVALIAGPTASGKSDLAVNLALALQEAGRKGVVINADSAQVYADLRILSARPLEEDMRGIPHRLFGSWDGAQPCSAADWAAKAKQEIENAQAAGSLPILVGGTGLYIRTLLEGIAPIPEIDSAIREEVRALPVESAYLELQRADPERAAKLAPADRQRIARALEVVRSTGRTLGEWQLHREGGIGSEISLTPVILLPDRDAVYARCDARFAGMMDAGAMAEVEELLARKLDPQLPVMRAIGVPELAEVLAGRLTTADAIINAQRATRNYAKRQFTWLRHQLPQDWPRIEPQNVDLGAYFEI